MRPGGDPDVTLIDPETRWTVDPGQFLSKSRNSPYGGWEVLGQAHTMIVGGEVRHPLGGIIQQPESEAQC